MQLEIEKIDHDPANARASELPNIEGLALSMKTQGQLQPIVVRPNPDADGRWLLLIGQRRLAAAKLLEWTTIKAEHYERMDDNDDLVSALAASAAENMQRAPMHPVDEWRAIASLTEQGMSIEGAADAIGIDRRLAKRLEWLGKMAPEVIERLQQEPELPDHHTIRTIALAPHDVQERAIKKRDWYDVRAACSRQRIPQKRAIFWVGDGGPVAWDEDFFCSLDDEERLTTTDVAGFMKAQEEALQKRVAASKGRMILCKYNAKEYGLECPAGFRRKPGRVLKKFPKDDPTKVAVGIKPAGDWGAGEIIEYLIEPKAKPAAAKATDGELPAQAPAPVAEKPPYTKAAQEQMAYLKVEAVQERLEEFLKEASPEEILRAVLMVFAFSNCRVQTASNVYGRDNFAHYVVPAFIDNEGAVDQVIRPDVIKDVAKQVISNAILFKHPNSFTNSGDAAEWLACMIDTPLPRCDTEEILRGVRGDILQGVARAHGIDADCKVSELRKRLIGKAPDWHPFEFGAERPEIEEPEYDEDDDDNAVGIEEVRGVLAEDEIDAELAAQAAEDDE